VIYAKAAVAAARIDGVNSLVHVTGGGLPGNVPRVLPPGLGAVIEASTWTPPGIFSELMARGSLTVDDAFGTFNMGVGYIAVAASQVVEEVIELFNTYGHQAWVLGSVEEQAAAFTLK
jgi:phosphoribosylformylglycinamidine cyclo-ligase